MKGRVLFEGIGTILEEIDTESEVACFMNAVHPQYDKRSYYVWIKRGQDKDKIYVFADNARYFYNEALREWLAENPKIQLLLLPTYSPNLNLIERLWKFLRKKVINLHYCATFDEFRKAIHAFFANHETPFCYICTNKWRKLKVYDS